MTKLEFWEIYYHNYVLYNSLALLVLFCSFFLLKILRFSLYHPVVFYYFFNFQFTTIAVIFLDYLQYIDEDLARYFYIFQFLFFIGFLYSWLLLWLNDKCSKGIILTESSKSVRVRRLTEVVSIYVFIISTIITYSAFGIPLFAESKWSVFSSIPLAGVIGRIGEVSVYILIISLTVKKYNGNKWSLFDKFIVFTLILVGVLSGKKMFFLDYFFIIYFTLFFLGGKITKSMNKKILLTFSLLTVVVLFSVFLSQLIVNESSSNPLELILKRFAMSGDAQVLGFPSRIVDSLNYDEDILSVLFFELKGVFSLFGISLSGPSLGMKMMTIHYPYLEVNMGPASTFDIFYYVYFKDFAFIMALVSGVVVGFFSTAKFRVRHEFSLLLQVFVCCNIYLLIYNPQVFISKIIFGVIYMSLLAFFVRIKR